MAGARTIGLLPSRPVLGSMAAVLALLVSPGPASSATGPRVAGQHPAYLPDASCAFVDNPGDDAVDAFHPAGTPTVKVVYAHPSDAPNQAAGYYPRLAQAVRDITEYVYLESEDRKSIRFDLGTSEGPDCVDIQRISLPQPTAYYVPPGGTTSTARLRADLAPLLGAQPSPRNFLVYLPSILNRMAGGLGGVPTDDTPGGASYLAGGEFAFVFNVSLEGSGSVQHAAQEAAHEVFHNLGAVHASAPNSAGGGHCNDGADLMCAVGLRCENVTFTTTPIRLPLDCGDDDYFSPDPPAGSYLATHWNTYNSPFLCEVGACVPDNLGPLVEIKGRRYTRDRTPSFRLRADADAVRIRCRIDSAPFRRCGRHFVAGQLDLGGHVLKAEARDGAGNTSPEPARLRFRIYD